MILIYANIDRLLSFTKKWIVIFLCPFLIYCSDSSKYKFELFSPSNNLAYNSGDFKFPTPVESDQGWGGGSWKWHIIDGLRVKNGNSGWMYGLAFTGGNNDYIDTCGWRQMTIDFGKITSINRSIVFFLYEIPDNYYILTWDDQEKKWDTSLTVMQKRRFFYQLEEKFNKETDIFHDRKFFAPGYLPLEDTFKTVSSSKIRFLFNNCDMDHGWVSEFEVYCDKNGDRPGCLLGN
jgi:hypothetical protein